MHYKGKRWSLRHSRRWLLSDDDARRFDPSGLHPAWVATATGSAPYAATADHRRVRQTSAEFARTLLEEASVNVIPGSGYGEYGEGYVRRSLTVLGDRNGERLQEAVTRIAPLL